MRRPTPPRVYDPKGGRPPKHGGEFVFGDPTTWGTEQAVTTTDTRLYGKATAQAWDRLHPRLTRRAAWIDYDGPLPIIEGTVVRLVVEKLPSGGVNKPVWLWWSGTGATETDVDRCWQSFLRRFDIEHTFRLFKQTLGWTNLGFAARKRPTGGHAGDRGIYPTPTGPTAGHRPAAALGEADRAEQTDTSPRPQGVQDLHAKTGSPAGAPKPSQPGPGRPPGSKNRCPAPRHDVGRILATGEAYSRPTPHQKGTKPRRVSQD